MRSGRGPAPDHDRKSVRPPKQKTKPRLLSEQTHVIKQCTGENGCGLWFACYSKIKHGQLTRSQLLSLDKRELLAFDKDKSSTTGLQSNCKQCKDEWELRPENIFARTRSFLVLEEPDSWELWGRMPGGAFGEFQRKWDQCNGVCHYCGAGLREWQVTGHILDRLDNDDRSHSPMNTQLCCWPCNYGKGTRSAFAWEIEIEPYLRRYGLGNVPHRLRDGKFKRAKIRSTKTFLSSPPSLTQQFDLFGQAEVSRTAAGNGQVG